VVKQDNDLEEIDLINSQYAILAYLMQRDGVYDTKKDFLLFRELVREGTLYEYIQEYFQLGHRSVAKNMMMAVAFSSYRTNTSEKLQFKELFPSVVKFIDDYKRSCVPEFAKDASKRFSIWLQQTKMPL